MKSITGVEINNPDVCVKGTTFACICHNCKQEGLNRLETLKDDGVPEGMTKESADAWSKLLRQC